jgi:hypothetical protein
MKRPLVILLAALAIGAVVFAGSYFAGKRACVATMSHRADDLSWLREEFHLNDVEMARIRQLHEGYMPECARMCAMIAAKNAEVQSALGSGTNVTAQAQTKLAELGQLRAQCQANMLRHFIAVSQAMPPEEGRCYLTEMEKITLNSHEQIEQSMFPGHDHGNN